MLKKRYDTDSEDNHETSAAGGFALVVNRDGDIRSVLNSAGGESGGIEGSTNISDIWSPRISAQLLNIVRRVLRDRNFVSEEVREGESGINVDFTVLPQAQDSAIIVANDISARQSELLRMHRLAYVDEPTALPNREFFLNELRDVVEHQQLKEGRTAVVVLNIEQLDESRNSYGSAKQQAILSQIAERLSGTLRGTNADSGTEFERRSFLARIDFHAFGIILPSIEEGEDAEAVAKRAIQAVAEPLKTGDRSLTLNANAGIALYPQDGRHAESLYENAFAAMEDARCSHDSNIKFHTGTVRLRTLQRQDLALELRTALDTGEFSINYQPVIERKTGKIRIVEALLRWPDSILGGHSTRKLVSIAERTSLISDIGSWVIATSCAQLATWKREGFPNLRLSVNISAQEFARPDLVQTLSAEFLRSGVQPTDVDIEINEHVLFRDAMKNFATTRALKSIGMRVVVDDYGVGSCSLAHLSHAPIDAIKIDNVLVGSLEASGRDNAACHAAVSLSHALGLDAMAEGVETEHQATLLADLGCDLMQGYFFFEPMTAEELTQYLELSNVSPRPKVVDP